MLKDGTPTYMSLFSSEGVGCYGFLEEGYICTATCELIPRRIDVQKYNGKCALGSGYICGDMTDPATMGLIEAEERRWKELGNDCTDVIVATPPCQGMSVANLKKHPDETVRNSLVTEAVKAVLRFRPRVFVFENVPAFLGSVCCEEGGAQEEIGAYIERKLGPEYRYRGKILNCMNYGGGSSRKRTLIIGVRKDLAGYAAPEELFPVYRKEKTLRELIWDLPRLGWGEISDGDIYHFFRTYPEYMRQWIHGLPEGGCAFDNALPENRPHRTAADGTYIPNVRKNADKYTRQYWDRPAPCVHTRTDQLASQNTVHPEDDRVFSVRELMRFMTVPDTFRWSEQTPEELSELSADGKRKYLAAEEMRIRQGLGEAVPTGVFRETAHAVKEFLKTVHDRRKPEAYAAEYGLGDPERLCAFIGENPCGLSESMLADIAEYADAAREKYSAFCTGRGVLGYVCRQFPDLPENRPVSILEPSAGTGNFIPLLAAEYGGKRTVNLDICDISREKINALKLLTGKMRLPENFRLRFFCCDWTERVPDRRYDLICGNPPFGKVKKGAYPDYPGASDLAEVFLLKACREADCVCMIMPKSLVSAPRAEETRKKLSGMRIGGIYDFGEYGFPGVLIETVSLCVFPEKKPGKTDILHVPSGTARTGKQEYFTEGYPYWLLYRDAAFDTYAAGMKFGIFGAFRDRQLTNAVLRTENTGNRIRILKSGNLGEDGTVKDIPGYDRYADPEDLAGTRAGELVPETCAYLVPNMSYAPRAVKKPAGMTASGSCAVLLPVPGTPLPPESAVRFWSSDGFRKFYAYARNMQTRSLNVDAGSAYFFGIRKDGAGDGTVYPES